MSFLRRSSNNKRGFSISKKLWMLAISVITLLGIMIAITAYRTKDTLNEQVNTLGNEVIVNGVVQVDQYFQELKTLSKSIAGSTAEFLETHPNATDNDLEPLLKRCYESLVKDLNIYDLYVGLASTGKVGSGSGWEEPEDYDARKRSWYIKAVQENKAVLTEPYVDAGTGKLLITVAAPINSSSGKILGVAAIDVILEDLSEMITSYKILGKGYGFLIDKEGNFIAHPKSEMIMKENMTKTSSLITPEIAEAGKKMVSSNKAGFADFAFQGENRRVFYAPTKSGFVFGIVFPTSDLNAIVMKEIKTQISLGAIVIVILGVLLYFFSKSITVPITHVTKALGKLGQLDLRDYENRNWLEQAAKQDTEIGQMASAALNLQTVLRQAMADIANYSTQTADVAGGLASLSEESVASLEERKKAIEQAASLMENNSASLQEINASVEEVSSSAQQAAQSATNGAETAAKMSAISEEVSHKVEEVTEAITIVGNKSKDTESKIKEMADAVMSITKLVDAIKSIAEQTNLLALNAAIEAARAGEHGRGFAVVAEEVRKLAEESANAAHEVENLITPLQDKAKTSLEATEESNKAVEDTIKLANESLGKLAEMVQHIKDVNDAMQNIAATSEEQAAAAHEMAQGVEAATQATMDTVSAMESVSQSSDEIVKASEQIAQEAQNLAHIAETL
ncbi:methyl-accepting chemotaxis protein, partial [Thermovirga sp.]|uniref:methyl-accepting chemotaxis protein n=1 Tax=Thermovirga sp. TaxID=2699834 RepID=UPI0025F552AC